MGQILPQGGPLLKSKTGGTQGCALGLGRLGLETSRDVARSRLGLVSKKIADVSVSSRSRDSTSRSRLGLVASDVSGLGV